MAEPIVWEDIPKSQVDPTTIDEAIADAIEVHDADPEAHLQALASLEAHRTNEILDALAESVVNDKLYPTARAYVAIVDASSPTDYDTLDSAVAYAITKGGGTILLTPGDHYVGSVLEIPRNINLLGVDVESTIIHTDNTIDKLLYFTSDLVTDQTEQIIQNLKIQNDGAVACNIYNTGATSPERVIFTNCRFTGGGNYVIGTLEYLQLDSITAECSNTAAFALNGRITAYNSSFTRYATATGLTALDLNIDDPDVAIINIERCNFSPGAATGNNWLGDASNNLENMLFTTISTWAPAASFWPGAVVMGNIININSSSYFEIDQDSMLIVGNRFSGGTGANIRLISGADNNVIVGNIFATLPTDTTGNNIISPNAPERPFITLSTSATACAFATNRTAQLTPNSTRTLTTTVPPMGTKCQLIILTSGTTSYTLTFGTGFKSTGTLATGASSARRFVVEFISDGTQLIETSRTIAIA